MQKLQQPQASKNSDTVLIPCPGCDKCRANQGYVLRRGQGRTTTAHEYLFLFTKTNSYFWDMENCREVAVGGTPGNKTHKGATAYLNGDEKHRTKLGLVNMGPSTTRIPRSVWTLSSEPTKSFGIVRWDLVTADSGLDASQRDIVRKASPSCPVHGCQDLRCGERAAAPPSRSQHTDGHPAPTLFGAHGESLIPADSQMPCTSDSPGRPCSVSAKPRSTRTRRTVPAPETNPSCTPCDETPCHTDGTPDQPASAGQRHDTPASSISLVEMVCLLSAGTEYHIVDTPSFQIPPGCNCSFYQKKTAIIGHFATYPSELVRRCLMPLSPRGCCPECGAQWAPVVEQVTEPAQVYGDRDRECFPGRTGNGVQKRASEVPATSKVIGYRPTCSCNAEDPAPCRVLDPFSGTGTTGQTACFLGHDYVGIELNPDYAAHSDKWINMEPRWSKRKNLVASTRKNTMSQANQLSLFS